MAPGKQSTLGKFLGDKENASKGKAKQATLTFGRNGSTKPRLNTTLQTSEVSGILEKEPQHNVDIDPDTVVDAASLDGYRNGDAEVNGAADPTSTPKRSKRDPTAEENEDSDEQPVLKRRKKNTAEKTHNKDHNSKPSSKGPQNVRGKTVAEATSKDGASRATQTDDETKNGTDVSSAEEDNVASEEDNLDESEVDDEPPVAPKLAKVQATMKASGKDPYPDWKAGDPVPYAALCTTFSLVELTTKRLQISAHCSLFLQQVLRLTPNDLLPTIQLMINKLAADYAGIELGIGESLIIKAISESTGRPLGVTKADHHKVGDLGLVAARSRGTQSQMFKPKPLTVRSVHEGLLAIAKMEGHGSQDKKVGAIKKLLAAADVHTGGKSIDITKDKGGPSEAKFLVRFLEGKLRLGLAEKTVIVALAQAMVTHEVSHKGDKMPSTDQLAKGEAVLKGVYSELPSYEVIIPAMLEHGISNLHETCKLQPGVPLKPMLAKPTKSITEVLDRFEGKNFTCEYKYDGERAQIHYIAPDVIKDFPTAASTLKKDDRGLASIFSRNSEDLSKKYPDILARLDTWVKPGTKSFVLDCETVAWDLEKKKVLPFQQLMTRKRKDVKAEDVKVKVCVFAFDMLFFNGEATVAKPLRERRELLHQAFDTVEGEFSFAQFGDTKDIEEIQHLLDESVKASSEGLMVKMLDSEESGYEPSKRSRNWLKVKKDYLSGIGDSLDLVVLGAYFGKGKRTSVYGAFLLAAFNPSTQNYETVCNIGTGFSETVLEELHTQLEEHVIERPKPFYNHSSVKNDQPEVWFDARFVWEVKTADLTLSPRYRAAIHEMGVNKGISLRFPRFIKQRDDKKPDEATTTSAVAEMYRKQESVGNDMKAGVDDDFEY